MTVVEEVANKYLVAVCAIDVNKHPDLAAQYAVRTVPTILLLRNDNIVASFVGVPRNLKTQLSDAIA